MTAKIVLIHPPVVKPSEPPAGIACLCACLAVHGVAHEVIDANLEGLRDLLGRTARSGAAADRWTARACKNLEDNLAALSGPALYGHRDRYSRAVLDINRVLTQAGRRRGVRLSLSDYADDERSPVKTDDLIAAALHPEDNPFYPYFAARLTQALNDSPDYLGFSLNYLSQALCTMAMIGFVKKSHPRQKILLGGSLATSWAHITGRTDYFSGWVDEIVAGAGEERLLRLLGVKPERPYGFADYRLFAVNRYLSPSFVLPCSAARGCWWRKCAFCPETAEANPYEPRPVYRVAEELSEQAALTDAGLIHLLDSSVSPALFSALAAKPPGVPWYGFARVTPQLADDDFCRALKAAGCVMLKLGIESGDPQVLEALHKGVDPAMASAALQSLHRAGIATYCYFLFGTPPETQAGAEKTLDFVARHADCIDYLNLAVFNLPAASPEARSLAVRDFYAGDLSLYKDFVHPTGWDRSRVRLFLAKTFKKNSAVAPIVARTPEFFTSNHAPFFVLRQSKDHSA